MYQFLCTHNIVSKHKIHLIEHNDEIAYNKMNTVAKMKSYEELTMICGCYSHIG